MLKLYILSLLVPLILSILVGFPLVRILKNIGAKQSIREDGPKEHLTTKAHIPTMGGVIFLLPILVIYFLSFFINKDFITTETALVLFITFIIAISGLIDDLLKIKRKHNKGISGWAKLAVQLILSIIIFYLFKEDNNILYLAWIFLVFAGSCNAFNLTDGLDGLGASVSIVSFCGLIYLLNYQGDYALAVFSIVFIGSLLGFLYFNKHPAKIFMGDTGSLAIGAAIGSIALISKNELCLLVFAIIPVLEALSVILQVVSCKLSKQFLKKDLRIFKMTPLHHHFELMGWKETTVVNRFFAFQAICTLIGILIMKFFVFD